MKGGLLDKKDKEILNILQEDNRTLLKTIARQVGLSIDSTHKRIKKMLDNKVFFPSIMIDPDMIGYSLSVDVKIKLKDAGEKETKEFVNYLLQHERVVELLSIIGDWDFTCVLIARDGDDFNNVANEIRFKFNKIIADWKSVVVLKVHKFEKYNMSKL